MTSDPSLDNVVKPQQEDAEPSPLTVRLDPRVGADVCTGATTQGGSDPCGGSTGKGDKGVV
jgi:hypothetical protein